MYGRLFDGYETLDYKIAYALSFFLEQERGFMVHTEKYFEKGRFIYRIWIAERERE
ncbi:hypothetical protein B4147_4971 [Bacillus wiedmannii]|uniref:Uncharacterized protein n=1 Tax=Bacillus wiedmannii TaxID=1890302 RepID=A0A0G8C2I5_9BACI|nr:hypothetical protein B4147_4971 [Bacillus wiedmannii]